YSLAQVVGGSVYAPPQFLHAALALAVLPLLLDLNRCGDVRAAGCVTGDCLLLNGGLGVLGGIHFKFSSVSRVNARGVAFGLLDYLDAPAPGTVLASSLKRCGQPPKPNGNIAAALRLGSFL